MNYFGLLLVLIGILFCVALHADPAWDEIHGNGVYTVAQKEDAKRNAEFLGNEFGTGKLPALARRTDMALSALMRIGALNLKRHGYKKDAAKLTSDWKKWEGEVERLVTQRDIGDFKPLSVYLALAYELLEYKLGYGVCYNLRLTDIKTINFAIPVVFHPCEYGETEFELHFVHDEKYRGLAPVVTYWSTVLACSIATYGAGYFFICSPLGMATELVMDRAIAPWLSPRLYNLVCKENP